jgi:hypothetical protein
MAYHAQDDDLAIKMPALKQLVHARKAGHRTALAPPIGSEGTTAGSLHQRRQGKDSTCDAQHC